MEAEPSVTTETKTTEAEASTTKPNATETAEPQTFSASYVKELREEAKASRKRAEALEQEVRDSEQHKASATELETRLAQVEKTHHTELAMTRLEAKALKAGILDPETLSLLRTDSLEIENGRFKDEDAVLEKFKTDKPHFFGSRSTSSTTKSPKSDVETSSGKLSKAQIEAEMKKYGL